MIIELQKRKKHLEADAERLLANELASKKSYAGNLLARALAFYLCIIALPLVAIGIPLYMGGFILLWCVLFGAATLLFFIGIALSVFRYKFNYVITDKELFIVDRRGWTSWKFSEIKKVSKNKKYSVIKLRCKSKPKKSTLFLGVRGKTFYKILLECKNILSHNEENKEHIINDEKPQNIKKKKTKNEDISIVSKGETNNDTYVVSQETSDKTATNDTYVVAQETRDKTANDDTYVVAQGTSDKTAIADELYDFSETGTKSANTLAEDADEVKMLGFDINEMD